MPANGHASHFAGGDITYEYIGDSTGVPYNYCITLTLYRRELGIGVGTTQTVSVNSGCFGAGTITVSQANYSAYNSNFVQGGTPRGDTNCVDQSDPGYSQGRLEEYRYRACVVLPGKCADYVFSWTSCCRNNNITNILTPGAIAILLEAELNNTIGDNTSPDFINPGAKFFCVGQSFTWAQTSIEPDGDSLYYSLGLPAGAVWASGYSTLQPMSTVNGFKLNPTNGVLNFTPSQPEVDVLKIVVEEYRLDPVSGIYLQVGSIFRDIQVPVLATCSPLATTGIRITQGDTIGDVTSGTTIIDGDSLLNVYGIDSIADFTGGYAAFDYVGYDCFDTILTLKVAGNLKCSSISPDGSDFRLIGPDSVTRPIVGVVNKCQSTLLTDEVDLILHKPLDVNGNYLLQVKEGNDGNTIENECGYGVKPFFSLLVKVENCPRLEYELSNVSVEYDQVVRLKWWINPNTYTLQNEELFNAWHILRSKKGDPSYYVIDRLDDPLDLFTRSYLDTSLEMYNVDQSSYQYRIQLVQNYSTLAPTNSVHTILLSEELRADSAGHKLEWTDYNGWETAYYELFIAKVDTTTSVLNWQSIAGPDPNLFAYDWLKPALLTPLDRGLYVFKVEATDPLNPSNKQVSESNWMYILVPYGEEESKEPETAMVPNIFSPNGDNVNDHFYVTGTEGFTSASIMVYNRWGVLVHKDEEQKARNIDESLHWDGRDISSEEPLADGVYYYVLNLTDNVSGQTAVQQGQVSIVRN